GSDDLIAGSQQQDARLTPDLQPRLPHRRRQADSGAAEALPGAQVGGTCTEILTAWTHRVGRGRSGEHDPAALVGPSMFDADDPEDIVGSRSLLSVRTERRQQPARGYANRLAGRQLSVERRPGAHGPDELEANRCGRAGAQRVADSADEAV